MSVVDCLSALIYQPDWQVIVDLPIPFQRTSKIPLIQQGGYC